jgi:nicotinate-nucleotide pyrophosphorylase
MEKFKVDVMRIECAVKEIEVEADNLQEANDIALEKADWDAYDESEVVLVDYQISDLFKQP